MSWQIVNIFVVALTTIGTLYGVVFAWKRREENGAKSFGMLALGATIAMPFYALQMISSDLNDVVLWSKFQYIGLSAMLPAWISITLNFNGWHKYLTRRNVFLLSLVPAITTLLAWTNEWHGLIWHSIDFDTSIQPPIFRAVYGEWAQLNLFYVVAVCMAVIVLLGRNLVIGWSTRRVQTLALISGTVIPWIGNFAQVLDINFGIFHPLPISFATGMAILWWAVFQIDLLNILPIAYDLVVDNIPNAVMVFDAHSRLVSVNQMGAQLLNNSPKKLHYQRMETLFKHMPPPLDVLKSTDKAKLALQWQGKQWMIDVRPLYNDKQTRILGKIVVWADETWRTQAERIQQEQRTLNDTLLSISTLINSTLDFDQVMAFVLESAERVVPCDAVNIMLISETHPDQATTRYLRGYSPQEASVLEQLVIHISEFSTFEHVLKTQEPLLIPNTREYQGWGIVDKGFQILCYICAPILNDGKVIGFLNIDSHRPYNLTVTHLAHLKLFAAQVASAIKNAHLHRQLQHQLGALEEANNHVKQLEQLKSDMIRLAAHDLRNPLASIQGYIELIELAADNTLNESAHVHLVTIQQQVERMNTMIEDILSLERVQELSKNTPAPVNVSRLADRLYKEYTTKADERDIHLTIMPPYKSAIVSADETLLYETMSNLVHNALKYTPSGGRVLVSLVLEQEQVVFCVIDTGYGIPEHLQSKLFTPFYRAVTQENKHILGTGLGLNLVKNVVTRYGGTLIFESKVGNGSTFGFRLPLISEQEMAT